MSFDYKQMAIDHITNEPGRDMGEIVDVLIVYSREHSEEISLPSAQKYIYDVIDERKINANGSKLYPVSRKIFTRNVK